MKNIIITTILSTICLIITGCQEPPPKKERIPFDKYVSNIVIEEDVNLPTLGRQYTLGGVCFIKLREYPMCLQHEVRHCIEGNFHEGKKSDEDCFH